MSDDSWESSPSYWKMLRAWAATVVEGLIFVLSVGMIVLIPLSYLIMWLIVVIPLSPLIVWYVFGFESAVVWALVLLCLLVFAQNINSGDRGDVDE